MGRSEHEDKAAKRLLPRAQRRAQIIAAAQRSFARNGFAATSMEDLALECGVTKMIIYRHFATKAELYRAVLDEIAARLDESVRRAGEWPGNITALVEFAEADPDGFVLLFDHSAREPEFQEHTEESRESALRLAEDQLRAHVRDPSQRAWAAQLLPRVLIEAILSWLAAGRPGTTAATTRTVRNLAGEAVRVLAAHDVG